MNKILIIMISIFFLMVPAISYAQSDVITTSSSPPPVSQQLVPEGDFALRLVTALNLGTPDSEAQAEDILTSAGIVPKNGWIADYPVTPIIVGELQSAVAAAADAKKLPMGRDEALKALQDVTAEFNLAIGPAVSGNLAGTQPQLGPSVINNYYYEEGPPVVTYYPPPWDYDYLYSWVAYPFWCSGFFFPGFFILNHFNVVVAFGHHHHLISNHFFDPHTHAFFRVDPTTRTMGRTVTASLGHTERFVSPEMRRSATSIFNRGFERTNRTMISHSGNMGRRDEMNFQQGQQRSFNPPDANHERMFNAPSRTGRNFGSSENFNRSFSPPSRSFSEHRSFGGFHGGGFSGGFHGGGGHHR